MTAQKVRRFEPSLEWLCVEYEDPRQVVEMLEDSEGTYILHADVAGLVEALRKIAEHSIEARGTSGDDAHRFIYIARNELARWQS